MKKISIILIIIIITLLLTLTYYKLKVSNSSKEKELFIKHVLKDNYKISNKNLIDNESDDILYKDSIIKNDVLSYEYSYFDDNKSITGRIFIDENENLYISNDIDNIIHKLSNIKFKTIYFKPYNYKEIYFYLISEDLELYQLIINSNDIKTVIIENMNIQDKIKNITNLEVESDFYGSSSTLFILNQENYVFDISSLIRYKDIEKSIYNKFFIFNDNTISNIYGKMLSDKDGKEYKMKYFFITEEPVVEGNKNTGIIITEDNKLIYLDDTNNNIYEYTSLVKNIDYDGGYPQVTSKLVLTFENNSKLIYNAVCTNYYCINKEINN